MKNILIIVFILVSINTYSQKNELLLEYNAYYNTSNPRVKKSFLGIESSAVSKYVELPEFKLIKHSQKESANFEKEIDANYAPKGVLRTNFIDLKKRSLSSIETMLYDKTIFNVVEKLPNFKWDVSSKQTKQIGKYKCNKAKTYFRGRNYIVWYTNELPLPFGPWKLNGAPGLILEAYDTTLKYRWVVKKISKLNLSFKKLIAKVKYDKQINIKDFIIEKYGNKNKRINKSIELIKSKLPRGSKVTSNSVNKRLKKELVFEWEEGAKKQ